MPNTKATVPLESLFSSLADRTRLRLLNLIANQEICVCYLVEVLQLSQPKISRHLAYLRKAGLVGARRDGKWIHYRMLNPKDGAPSKILEATLQTLREDAEMQKDRARLATACCKPERYVLLKDAPMPSRTSA